MINNKIIISDRTYDPLITIGYKDSKNNNTLVSNLNNFYDYIEDILREFIHCIMTSTLETHFSHLNYWFLVGGKAINSIIKENILEKSFDFDIHLFNNTTKNNNEFLDMFGILLYKKTNKIINSRNISQMRFFLFEILKYSNLVDDTLKNFYGSLNNKLFYYGNRVKQNGLSIPSLFIYLKLKNNLVKKNNNIINITTTKIYNSIDIPFIDDGNNNILYPICDIDIEHSLSFGLPIYDPSGYYNLQYTIRGSNLVFTLYKLIKYAQISGYKKNKMINKLKTMLNIKNYKCSFVTRFQKQNIIDELNNMNLSRNEILTTTNISPVLLNDQNNFNIFQINLKSYDVLNEIINYLYEDNNKLNYIITDCTINKVILNTSTPNTNTIFKNTTYINQYDTLSHITALLDTNTPTNNYNIMFYTWKGDQLMNMYLHCIRFNIPFDIMDMLNYFKNYNVRYNETLLGINFNYNKIKSATNASTMPFIVKLKNLFESFHHNIISNPIYNEITDFFYAYRLTLFFCYKTDTGELFNPNVYTKGSIFYSHVFMSCSYATNFSFPPFLHESSVLYRIKINKNNKNWIYLGKYSTFPNENEILINANVYFIITNHDYVSINVDGYIFDILMVDLELCENLNDVVYKSKILLKLYEQESNNINIEQDDTYNQNIMYANKNQRDINYEENNQNDTIYRSVKRNSTNTKKIDTNDQNIIYANRNYRKDNGQNNKNDKNIKQIYTKYKKIPKENKKKIYCVNIDKKIFNKIKKNILNINIIDKGYIYIVQNEEMKNIKNYSDLLKFYNTHMEIYKKYINSYISSQTLILPTKTINKMESKYDAKIYRKSKFSNNISQPITNISQTPVMVAGNNNYYDKYKKYKIKYMALKNKINF